jgi:NitT/TauT family transport system substrate-binding protein
MGFPACPRRQQLLGYMAMSTTLPWLNACTPRTPLTIAMHPWIGYETLSLASEFGWLPEEIQWVKTENLGASIAALSKNEVDAACITLDRLLVHRAAGHPLQAALVFDISAGADVVLCQPSIESASQLNGKRIAYENNALGQLMLAILLERAGLEANAVHAIVCPPEAQLAAWQAGEIDAAITYEPVASLLRRAGARQLMSSRDVPDTVIDILEIGRAHV